MRWSRLVLAFAGAGVTLPLAAAEFVLEPSFNSRLTQNDNLLMSPDDRRIETFLLELSPRLRASASAEKWRVTLDTRVTLERFDDDEFDFDNQNVSLQMTRRTETLSFNFVAQNARQNTRGTELQELGVIGFEVDRRDSQYFRPSVTWTMNPTNQLTVGGSFSNVHFDGFSFSDYDYYTADVSWAHQWDEKTRFDITAFGNEYQSAPPTAMIDSFFACVFGFDGIDRFDSETLGISVGFNRQSSTKLSYRGSVGYRDVTNENERRCREIDNSLRIIQSEGKSDGFVLDTGLTYQGETYGVDFSLAREVTPAGLNFLTERDSFTLNVTYRFTEKLTGSLLVAGFETASIDESIPFERDGLRVGPRVIWQIDNKLSVNGGVLYRTFESLTVSGRREGINIFAGFNYRFTPTRFSR
ncbi:MAG: hypothetical protein AAF465_08015 [Pseudomonadota bacterium]